MAYQRGDMTIQNPGWGKAPTVTRQTGMRNHLGRCAKR